MVIYHPQDSDLPLTSQRFVAWVNLCYYLNSTGCLPDISFNSQAVAMVVASIIWQRLVIEGSCEHYWQRIYLVVFLLLMHMEGP